jgi:hypothetical protein
LVLLASLLVINKYVNHYLKNLKPVVMHSTQPCNVIELLLFNNLYNQLKLFPKGRIWT